MDYYPLREIRQNPLPPPHFIVWVIIALIIAVMICIGVANAQEIDLSIIAKIESNNNPNAVSPAGAIGTYQIMPIVLKEYNTFFRADLKEYELFDPLINFSIAQWYLTQRIPQMLRHYLIPDNIITRLIAYNWGIGNLVKFNEKYASQSISETLIYLPDETRQYIKKYKRLAGIK